MKRSCKILAITYGELQSWYRYGEIKVNSSRITYVGLTESDVFDTDSSVINSLLDDSPQLSFDDEEGIVLIQLTTSYKRVSLSEYGSLIINFLDIEKFIPLTSRAKRILESRLSDFNIDLSEPFFEKQVNQMWFTRRLRDAHLGGDALIKLLFNSAEQCINESLYDSIAYPIKEIDFSDIEINLDGYRKTWLSKTFSYVRGRPSRHESLDYFIDFGSILKGFVSNDDSECLEKYRDKFKEINAKYKESKPGIDVLLCDKSLSEVSIYLLEKLPLAFPAPVEAFILFLKFREEFIDAEQLINPEELSQKLKKYSKVDFSHKVVATWLLGCYAGFQRISPIVYATNSDKIEFYTGEALSISKIGRHDPIVQENTIKADVTSEVVSLDKGQDSKNNDLFSESEIIKPIGIPNDGGSKVSVDLEVEKSNSTINITDGINNDHVVANVVDNTNLNIEKTDLNNEHEELKTNKVSTSEDLSLESEGSIPAKEESLSSSKLNKMKKNDLSALAKKQGVEIMRKDTKAQIIKKILNA